MGKWINVIFRRGNVGVDIFLLLSGIGLYYSYRKDDNIRRFYMDCGEHREKIIL